MGRHVLVAFDGSAHSRAALAWAARESRVRRAGLLVCQVWDGPSAALAAAVMGEEHLAGRRLAEGVRLAERLLPGHEVRPVLLRGDAGEELVGMSLDAVLLVVGRSRPGAVAGLLHRSVMSYAVAHAGCPVVAVRAPAGGTGDRRSPAGPGSVVAGIDGTAGAAAVMEFAVHAAHRHGLPVRAVHAAGDGQGDGEHVLAELVEMWRRRSRPAVPIVAQVVPDRPLAALLAGEHDPRLIVIGHRGSGGLRARLLGSVGQGLLHHAECPVAVVREPAPG
ncbi:universal stress protein [Sphaerisporangium rufum]|uniref:Universal stress protein n=1 Tax=Sphaerisporangium rufum TaxID=1381558 RepID=A0A919R940_9ACTN|nr:universal stress protein [Sphaerisporangium rufum]GII81679.1 universal stress protein [Sphaerisporangium rufum]